MAYPAIKNLTKRSPFTLIEESQWWKLEGPTIFTENLAQEVPKSLGTYLKFKQSWFSEVRLSLVLEFERKLEHLQSIYIIREGNDVLRFIRENDFLVDLLLDAYIQIYSYFCHNSNIFLELHRDPEEEDFEELFIVIKSPYNAQRARKLMDLLGETWFLDVLDETQGKLCITEESI